MIITDEKLWLLREILQKFSGAYTDNEIRKMPLKTLVELNKAVLWELSEEIKNR